jgi:hypothetical protein
MAVISGIGTRRALTLLAKVGPLPAALLRWNAMKRRVRGKSMVLTVGAGCFALCVTIVVLFGDRLSREYRVWRLSFQPSLILETAMAPPEDPWRTAIEELLHREYPPGLWRPRPGTLRAVTLVPHADALGAHASVNGQTQAEEFLKYLSDQAGAPVHVGDGKLLKREAWTAGVIEVLDVSLARAILHARGIAVLEVEEDGQKVLWAVDRSDFRRGERP